MDEMKKTHFDVAGSSLALGVPFTKVDQEKRIVSGFATLDNVDTQGDVVTAEASLEAFKTGRSNLRESHTNIAVGKVVNFREEEYYHAEDDAMYKGIYVDAYISKGAPNVWEKVLDGTLAAFSIGGSVLESKSEFRKGANGEGKQVRVITKYALTELSICDAGANQLANVFSIQKVAGSNGETVVEGDVVEIDLRNVLYCKKDGRAIKTTLDSANCTICEEPMQNTGWFETTGNEEENVSKVKELVNKFNDSKKGGNTLEKEQEVKTHGDHPEDNETVDSASVENLSLEDATKTESDDQIIDVPAGEASAEEVKEIKSNDEVAKAISDFQGKIEDALKKGSEEQQEAIKSLEEKFTKSVTDFEEKFNSLNTEGAELKKRFDELQGKVENVEKNLGEVSKVTASKKSGDLGGESNNETIAKSTGSFWSGNFFSVDQ